MVQYAVLVHMLAQVCDMEVGELVHVIADAHIYDRHIPIIRELIRRPVSCSSSRSSSSLLCTTTASFT